MHHREAGHRHTYQEQVAQRACLFSAAAASFTGNRTWWRVPAIFYNDFASAVRISGQYKGRDRQHKHYREQAFPGFHKAISFLSGIIEVTKYRDRFATPYYISLSGRLARNLAHK